MLFLGVLLIFVCLGFKWFVVFFGGWGRLCFIVFLGILDIYDFEWFFLEE